MLWWVNALLVAKVVSECSMQHAKNAEEANGVVVGEDDDLKPFKSGTLRHVFCVSKKKNTYVFT